MGIPDKSGEVILALLQGMGNTHARLMFALVVGGDDARCMKLAMFTAT